MKYKPTKDETRILTVMANMPCGALESVNKHSRVICEQLHDGPVTIEQIADYLEALRERVRQFFDEAEKCKCEHRELVNDLAVVGRVFARLSAKQ